MSLSLKRAYKALKKNPNSSQEEIDFAKQAYLAAKQHKASNKRSRDEESNETKSSLKRQRPNNNTTSSLTYCTQHHITVTGTDADIAPYKSFSAAPFGSVISQVLTTSYKEPTPVQAQAWPIILAGRDLISVAKTGSGKTCAFLLPLMHALASATEPPPSTTTTTTTTTYSSSSATSSLPSPIGLVLAPVRELAIQINIEALRFAKPLNLRCCCLYGGAPKHNQINSLRGGGNAFPHLVVATPGRLLDLCGVGAGKGNVAAVMSLRCVEYFVLDEADRMLDLGFQTQLNTLSKLIGNQRQTLFFSATWPTHVQQAAQEMLKANAVQLRIGDGNNSGEGESQLIVQESIDQQVKVIRADEKRAELHKLLVELKENEGKTIIFFSTKITCDETARLCGNLPNLPASAALHGNLDQRRRLEVMHDFRTSNIRLLFATDVAARGLDILDIDLVVNYDFPVQRGAGGVEEYVHRIGRTGRAGRRGRAVTFFTKEDAASAQALVSMLMQSSKQSSSGSSNIRIPKDLVRMAKDNQNDAEAQRLAKKREEKKERRKRMKVGRPGDWKCSCGAMVFASKTRCFKCGEHKSESERPLSNISFS